jgi:hypothetical protein
LSGGTLKREGVFYEDAEVFYYRIAGGSAGLGFKRNLPEGKNEEYYGNRRGGVSFMHGRLFCHSVHILRDYGSFRQACFTGVPV